MTGSSSSRRRATSADVARRAGVSRTTVSYVLNRTPHQAIPDATRQRVLDAAAELDYTPSAAARALQSGRSDVVLCLLPDWPIRSATGTLLDALSSALARGGLTLLAQPRPASGPPAPQLWRTAGPAGVVAWAGSVPDDEVAAMRASGIAVALLDGASAPGGGAAPDDQGVGRVQVEHLAAVGHGRLGYALPDDTRVRRFSDSRLAGVRAACADVGLGEPLPRTVPLDPAAAADAVRDWTGAGVTGVCAYNDEVALAVLAGMRLLGLAAPGDLAVVGVDDLPSARLAAPPLTTVTIDHDAIAELVAQLLLHALDGRPAPAPPGREIARLVRRDSA